MPPHNLLLGHLALAASISGKLPSDAHAHYIADQVRQHYPDLGPVFYLDLWPFSELMLIVQDPEVVSQFCQADRLLPKHPGFKSYLYPLTGGLDLNCLDGQAWKLWRKLFNPGFSSGHITSLVPNIVDEVLTFKEDLLKHAAKDEMFSFEEHALSVTLNVIGKIAL
jgi:cytochrome P450